MSECEVCGRRPGQRLGWNVQKLEGVVEPAASPVRVWKLCDYRHHAICVRCLREVDDAVALDAAGDVACAAMMVAESVVKHAMAQQGQADDASMRNAVALATLDYRNARVQAYEHHRKAMARLRAGHEAARAKEPGA